MTVFKGPRGRIFQNFSNLVFFTKLEATFNAFQKQLSKFLKFSAKRKFIYFWNEVLQIYVTLHKLLFAMREKKNLWLLHRIFMVDWIFRNKI